MVAVLIGVVVLAFGVQVAMRGVAHGGLCTARRNTGKGVLCGGSANGGRRPLLGGGEGATIIDDYR